MKKTFNNMSIGVKLPLIMSLLVALTIMIMAAANYRLTSKIIIMEAEGQLHGAADSKKRMLSKLFEDIERDLRLTAESTNTTGALIALADGYTSLENREEVLHRVYITENPNSASERDLLVSADTGSSYGYIHAVYHPGFNTLQDEMGYYDIFLMDTVGNLVYSVFKEADFATNLLTGEWRNSGLAEVYNQAMTLSADDKPAFVDFAAYGPSNGAAAAFAAKPVFNSQGDLIGVLAYQMPTELINSEVGNVTGLDKTAQGYLVGADLKFRTDLADTEEVEALVHEMDSEVVRAALAGESGTLVFTDSFGAEVMGAYQYIDFLGTRWASIIQVETDDILSGVQQALVNVVLIALAIFAGALAISIFFSRGISRPVVQVTESLSKVSDGEFEFEIQNTERGDEVGALARATEVFKQNASRMQAMNAEREEDGKRMAEMAKEREAAALREVELAKKKEEDDRLAAEAREEMMRSLDSSFGQVVEAAIEGEFSARVEARFDDRVLNGLAENINRLLVVVDTGVSETGVALKRVADGDLSGRMEGDFRGAFGKLQDNVNAMILSLRTLVSGITASGVTLSESSNELRDTADNLSRRTEQNAASLEETSAALNELSTSIKQVSTNVAEASVSAQAARDTAKASESVAAEAASSMDRISDASKEIARVIGVIDDIAFQINLLALNAGVEAARAGDAGRGFSVVASEVRQLAQRASEAAKEIGLVITESDSAVTEGVAKVGGAKASLETIAESIIMISTRVDEVSEAISKQALGIGEITDAVGQIDTNTQKQAASFEEVTASGAVLANQAESLKQSVTRFKTGEEAAVPSDAEVVDVVKATAPIRRVATSGNAALDQGWDEF